jgi:CheY-like chemotaxis protein
MSQYSWSSRTELIEQGAVKETRIEIVHYGPAGQLQRTPVNDLSTSLAFDFLRVTENVSTPRSRGPRVLLVDDDDSLRRAMMRNLRLEGFDVTGYASVAALLAAGMPERDACLVLDVNMPGIDGIAFKRTLVESGRDLPTVFITALEPEDVCGPLAALAPVAVLFKPFKNEDLLAAIGRMGMVPGSET